MKKRILLIISLICILSTVTIFTSACGCGSCGGKKKTYALSFETFGGQEIQSKSYKKGAKIGDLPSAVKEGYEFIYWATDESLKEKFELTTMPGENLTVYAYYKGDKSSRITFNTNGGTPVEAIYGKVGTPIDKSKIGQTTLENYVFEGWYTEPDFINEYSFTTFDEEDIILYAKWSNNDSYYYVTYVDYDGTENKVAYLKDTVTVAPETQSDLVYRWCSNSTLTKDFEFGTALNKNVKVYAEAYSKDLVVDGSVVKGYTGNNTTIVVPKKYNGTEITMIDASAFYGNETVKAVYLPDSINSIGNYAFAGCSFLKSINLSENLVNLGNYAFYRCERLLTVGDTTGLKVISEGAFDYCKLLTEFNFSADLIEINDYAFAGCTKLVEVTGYDKLKKVGEFAFVDCTSLQKFDISPILATIGNGAFKNCPSLNEINGESEKYSLLNGNLVCDGGKTLVKYLNNTSKEFIADDKLENIYSYAFENNSSIKKIDLTNATALKTNLGVFYGMKSLEKLVLNNFGTNNNGEQITNLAYLFGAKSATDNTHDSLYVARTLKSVEIKDKPTTLNDYAFYGCTSIEEIIGLEGVEQIGAYALAYTGISDFVIGEKVTKIGESAFAGCRNYLEYNVEAGNAVYAKYNGCLYTKDLQTLLAVAISKKDLSDENSFAEGVTTFAENAFKSTTVTKLYIPESVELSFASLKGANCVKELYLPYIGDGKTNKYMLYVFGGEITKNEEGKLSLTSACIPDSLEEITLYKDVDKIDDFAFMYATSLKVVHFDKVKYTSIGMYAFFNTGIQYFTSSSDVINMAEVDEEDIALNIYDGCTEIGECAFANCNELNIVNIGSGVEKLGEATFAFCRDLKEINFAESRNKSLQLVIPERFAISYNTTNSSSNSSTRTYNYLSYLEKVTLPSTVVAIGDYAFYYAGTRYYAEEETLDIDDENDGDEDKEDEEIVLNETTYNEFKINLGDTKVETLGKASFYYSSLKSIEIPYTLKSIGSHAFVYCDILKNITIGDKDNNSMLEKIGMFAFAKLSHLEKITLYKTIASVEEAPTMAKYESSEESQEATYTEEETLVFAYGSEKYKIYVPSESLELYRNAEGWKVYSGKLTAIE